MNAKTKHTPGPDFPVSLTYDNSTGAHGVGCVYFPDGFALDTAGGPGADPRSMPAYREAMMREVVRRWNAHGALLSVCEEIERRLSSPLQIDYVPPSIVTSALSALRAARGS